MEVSRLRSEWLLHQEQEKRPLSSSELVIPRSITSCEVRQDLSFVAVDREDDFELASELT